MHFCRVAERTRVKRREESGRQELAIMRYRKRKQGGGEHE